MTCDEIRERFLKFFEARGHAIVASDSLIPAKDPSVLFTGAGMNQFKEQFMGHNVTYKRAATSQKCLRTADLENVGRTPSHHTFFEMLGNFSFGDYFKKEAITWAWEFLTQNLKLKTQYLSVSVYEEDDETYNIWLNHIKVPKEKILKMGDKENFWPSEARKNGPNGPCGPCSEIFYNPPKGEPIEVWNLVFTQFERREGGALNPLPSKNIDTGMGLERLASVIQGVATNFEIDIFVPIIKAIEKELNPKSLPAACLPARQGQAGEIRNTKSDINAIADHIRAVTFTIADGVYPSNEERGFVVRKLIRRATQRALKVSPAAGPFLYKIVPVVAKVMKQPYPEIEKQREIISQVVKGEEERFQGIIKEVVPLLKEEFLSLKSGKAKRIPGEIIFRYSDEKGVPLDFQREIAQDLGMELDEEGFNRYLEEQKGRSRQKSKISKEIFTAPAGLARKKDEEWDEASKQKIRMNHTATHLLHAALRQVLGEHARQSGSLVYPERLRFDFTHPKKVGIEEIEKIEELVNKNIASAQEVRKDIMKLQEARQQGAVALFGEKYGDEVVVRSIGDFSKELCGGDHVRNTREIKIFKIIQEGSISAGTRRIEAITGEAVYEWLLSQVATLKDRSALEAEGLGEEEEIITKVNNKIFEIDTWIAKKAKEELSYQDLKKWADFEDQLLDLIEALAQRRKAIERENQRQRGQEIGSLAGELIKEARDIKGQKVISRLLPGMDMNSLRKLSDELYRKAPDAVVLLASDFGGKANLILGIGKDLVARGVSANDLIKPIAACVGGSGGGRPELAQAGGKDVSRLGEAVELIYKLIGEKI